MRDFSEKALLDAARCGTGLTLVCAVFTLGCEPHTVVSCHADRDCPSYAAFCGCDGLCEPTAVTTPDPDAGAPAPITVLLARIEPVPTDADSTEQFGIDLDSHLGGGCGDADDFISAITGTRGVDNQLGVLSPTLDQLVLGDGWQGALETTVRAGTEVIVLEVTAIDAGCARTVHAWTARAASVAVDPSCAAVTNEHDCEALRVCAWMPTSGACAGIAGAQTWQAIDDLGEVPARMVAGRLRTAPFDTMPLLPTIAPPPATPVLAPLVMHQVVIEADVSGTILTRGELGGAIAVSDGIAWTNANLLPPSYGRIDDQVFRDLVQPDLIPSGGNHCDDFSAGLGFETVTAVLVH